MTTATIRGLATGFAMMVPVAGAAQVTTDAGTIDPAQVERFFNQPGYSPYAGHHYPMRPLWGEIHLHTSWSGDAIAGGTRVGPEEALRYAEGAEIVSSTGQPVKLSRPYDYLMVVGPLGRPRRDERRARRRSGADGRPDRSSAGTRG